VRTPAWDHRIEKDPGVVARTARFYPLGRLVEPAEVAAAVLFLASPLAGAITGAALPVDCGLSAGNHGFVEDVLDG
jgi:NAD(P)-dependent dehydrogenase (short-subunit alcohol dehydrogenase family)